MGYDDLCIDFATEPDRDQEINNFNKGVMDRAEKMNHVDNITRVCCASQFLPVAALLSGK